MSVITVNQDSIDVDLSGGIPQLRRKGNRIPGGLQPFVGQSSLLLLTGRTSRLGNFQKN
jgi:hypothetical protein